MGRSHDAFETWTAAKLDALAVHSAAAIFPLLVGDEFEAFVHDVETHGLREPLVVFQDELLDGRNRLAACKRLGIDAPVRAFEGSEQEAIGLVVSLNLRRRQLDAVQSAAVGRRLLPLYEAAARESHQQGSTRGGKAPWGPRGDCGPQSKAEAHVPQPYSGGSHPVTDERAPQARALAAAAVGVGERTIQDGKWIFDHAPDVEELMLGRKVKSVKEAKRLAALAPEDRRDVLDEVARGEARNINTALVRFKEKQRREQELKPEAPGRVRHQDAALFLESLDAESVDLILTDPPYMTDVDDIEAFADRWVAAAIPRLKPTAQAYICVGNYPEELAAYLSALRQYPHIQQRNLIYWRYKNTIGPKPSDGYRQNVQAVFYLRGPEAPPLHAESLNELDSVVDINAPDGRLGERFHAWQKPDRLAELFVRHGSSPGDLVVDPFAGTGTFLIAAAKLGRRALGADNSDERIRIAIERGCERAA